MKCRRKSRTYRGLVNLVSLNRKQGENLAKKKAKIEQTLRVFLCMACARC
jgi:hypothetical protein